jgi:serine/threonine-protein kinase HipA
LYKSGQKPELAPAYDLLSTAVYPDLSSKMAMKIGGKYKPEDVFLRHWHRIVQDTAAAKRNLEKQMQETAKACLEKAENLKSDLEKDDIRSPVFDDILAVITKRSERLKDGF